MQTRYCFNPDDPTLRRYVLTEFLMDEGLVECPPPGEDLPIGLLSGAGGVLDRVGASLAQAIAKKLGPDATEDRIKAVSNAILGMDPDNLASLAQPVQKPRAITPPATPPPVGATETDPNPQGAMGSAMAGADAAPIVPLTVETPQEPATPTVTETEPVDPNALREMHQIPQVDTPEPVESAIRRIFNEDITKVTKMDLCSHALKRMKVKLDIGKTKPLLIRDIQLIELADQNQEA